MKAGNAFHEFLRFLCWREKGSRGIPGGKSVVTYFEAFSGLLERCQNILDEVRAGADFAGDQIQNQINSGEIRDAFGRILSLYAFKRLTTQRLTEMANAIIDTSSCVCSISALLGIETDLKHIASQTTEKISSYITQTGIAIDQVSSFNQFDCSSFFAEFLDRRDDLRIKLKQKELELEKMKERTYVCYNCGDLPAVSALLPCGHAFLCHECLSQAVDSGITHRCYACKREVAEVIRLHPAP